MSSTIVFIHGLFMNGVDMSLLRYRFKKSGYDTYQFSYKSTKNTPFENAKKLSEFINKIHCKEMNFICHSLGGIILRHYLSLDSTKKLNNIVMLGTPNQTSIVAKAVTKWSLGRKLLGLSVENGLTGILPPWDGKQKLGIIAGYFPVGSELLTPIIKNPNDGTVSVEETRLDRSNDHITLNCSHLGLLFSKKVFLQTKHFLEHSSFIH